MIPPFPALGFSPSQILAQGLGAPLLTRRRRRDFGRVAVIRS
jgi:hypothetical protein